MSSRDAMTTNDTKALINELRQLRAMVRDNTDLLRVLLKQAQKAEAREKAGEFKWPPSGDDD